MKTYVILRRSGWSSPAELGEAEHASRAMLRVDEIIEVADTVVVRPDPEPATV